MDTRVNRMALAGLLVLTLQACGSIASDTTNSIADATANDPTGAAIIAADGQPENWLSHGRNYSETRHSPLTQIDTSNVGSLGLVWAHDLDTGRGQEATPLIVEGIMYTTSAWSKVQAFDGVTGQLLWQYDPEVPGATAASACCDVVNRGVAYWGGKLFVGTLDGRLIALNAKTGMPVWSVATVEPNQNYTITGAPRVIKGRVIIGNGGAEYGVRGFITAYDAEDGDQLWRFYTVPSLDGKADGAASDSVLDKMRASWLGTRDASMGGGGGTVWDSMAYDPDLDLLYIGVGNGSYWPRGLRTPGGGDTLFVSSIVALRPETGEYVWHYQETPGDQWDYTATAHMILADVTIDGQLRKVLMQAPKNGFFYVLDRENGQLISAEPYTVVNWASKIDLKTGRPVINPEADYVKTGKTWLSLPGPTGGHDWMPMAFNPDTGLVYIPEQQAGFPYRLDPGFTPKPLGVNLGIDLGAMNLPDDAATRKAVRASVKGSLVAWDPVSQKKVWSVPHSGAWNGGVLSTAGGLIFQGDGEGFLSAYDAKTGGKLWSFDLQTGIVAPPVTWARDGKQYVTIVAGWGGVFPLLGGDLSWGSKGPIPNRSRVLTFALNATGSLPAPAPIPARQVPDVAQFASAETIALGQKAYDRTCVACHGSGAMSGGIVPDLRYSPVLADAEAWKSVVADGILADRGMVGFSKNFSAEEIEAIRAYVIERSRVLRAQR